MSGTSLDGVDAALLETDGEDIAGPGPGLTIPYDDETRALLRAALDEARGVAEGAPVPHSIREAERHLTEAHAEAVKALLDKAGLAAGRGGADRLSRPDHPAPARRSTGPGRSATARCWRGSPASMWSMISAAPM